MKIENFKQKLEYKIFQTTEFESQQIPQTLDYSKFLTQNSCFK